VYIAVLVVLFAGVGAYAVAERRGRSGALWLLSTMGVVAGSYVLASQAAGTLAGSNAIFDSATGTTRAEVDGECLALEFRGADPLTLRPHGTDFTERDLRVAAVEGIVAQLR